MADPTSGIDPAHMWAGIAVVVTVMVYFGNSWRAQNKILSEKFEKIFTRLDEKATKTALNDHVKRFEQDHDALMKVQQQSETNELSIHRLTTDEREIRDKVSNNASRITQLETGHNQLMSELKETHQEIRELSKKFDKFLLSHANLDGGEHG